jgi:hypothetical protein
MKQLLLTLSVIFIASAANSQVYIGDHKLDTLNRAYVMAEVISDEYFIIGKRAISIDIGKGEKGLELFEYKKGRIELNSIVDLLTIFNENGWIKDDYQVLISGGRNGLSPTVRHIFIFRKKQ